MENSTQDLTASDQAIRQDRPHTLVLGAGVIGLSLAWELARRGEQVRVATLGTHDNTTSWAGAGILPSAARKGAVDPYERLMSLSSQLHPEWAERLGHDTGMDTGFRRCGGLHLARTPGEQATLVANQFWWEEHGIAYESLTHEQLTQREPNLSTSSTEEIRSAWLLSDECQLRNPWHLQALGQACEGQGVHFQDHAKIERFEFRGSRAIYAITDSGKKLDADQFCICCGAWSRMLLEHLQHENGIMPIRGQMVLYRGAKPLLQHVINEGHRYLVPREDGRLLAGSVEEEVGYDCQTTDEAIGQIRNWAEGLLEPLRGCEVEKSWAGLRPGSYDTLPYLGRVPGTENVYVATGHFRSGIYLSCGTAVVMADLLQGNSPRIDLQPFRIGRG